MKKTESSNGGERDLINPSFVKVSMNLNQRSVDNVNRLCELLFESNKTRVVSVALELTRVILEMKNRGEKFYSKDGKVEKELIII